MNGGYHESRAPGNACFCYAGLMPVSLGFVDVLVSLNSLSVWFNGLYKFIQLELSTIFEQPASATLKIDNHIKQPRFFALRMLRSGDDLELPSRSQLEHTRRGTCLLARGLGVCQHSCLRRPVGPRPLHDICKHSTHLRARASDPRSVCERVRRGFASTSVVSKTGAQRSQPNVWLRSAT